MLNRAAGLLLGLILAGCGGDPAPINPEASKPPPETVKGGVWEGFFVNREGTVRIVGWIEPVVAEENIRIDYLYEFTSEPGVNQKRVQLYLDPRESGVKPGQWVGRKVAVVGRVQPAMVVGHQVELGWDTKRRIVGDVMKLVDVEVP